MNDNKSNKFTFLSCKADQSSGILILDLAIDEQVVEPTELEIFQIVISSFYLYLYAKFDKTYSFGPFDLSAVIQHVPNVSCILDIEVFDFFVKNSLDMFVMLEILTLQALLLEKISNNDTSLLDPGVFKNLTDKLIAKTKEETYLYIIPNIEEEHLKMIENIYATFNGATISHVDFNKITNMVSQGTTDYKNINASLLKKLINTALVDYELECNSCVVKLNKQIIYNSAVSV